MRTGVEGVTDLVTMPASSSSLRRSDSSVSEISGIASRSEEYRSSPPRSTQTIWGTQRWATSRAACWKLSHTTRSACTELIVS
jgi:hypothetical protein